MVDEQIAKDRPEVLYHYCSVATFFNIIKNKSIWLSDISKSNDSEELKWFMKSFEILIKDVWQEYLNKRLSAGKGDDPAEMQCLFSEIEEVLHSEVAKSWAFCLSEKRDDLGQWRGYADDGSGVAIGFHIHAFDAINVNQILYYMNLDTMAAINPHFQKVMYGADAIDYVITEFKSIFDDSVQLIQPSRFAGLLQQSIPKAIMVSPFLKNDGFREEQEWRLVYSLREDEIMQGKLDDIGNAPNKSSDVFCAEKFGYIEKGKDLVSHIEYTNAMIGNAISEIVLGPKCKLSENEVYAFLITSGLFPCKDFCSVKVSKSASSYR